MENNLVGHGLKGVYRAIGLTGAPATCGQVVGIVGISSVVRIGKRIAKIREANIILNI